MIENLGLQELINGQGIWVGTYFISLISGFFPIINAELMLLMLSSNLDKNLFIPVIIIATLGQMTAKALTYFAGKGVLKISIKKYESKLDIIKEKMEKWKSKMGVFMFISAFSGIPPFYAVSVVAGMTRLSFWRFLLTGIAGRSMRFSMMMLFPVLFQKIF